MYNIISFIKNPQYICMYIEKPIERYKAYKTWGGRGVRGSVSLSVQHPLRLTRLQVLPFCLLYLSVVSENFSLRSRITNYMLKKCQAILRKDMPRCF